MTASKVAELVKQAPLRRPCPCVSHRPSTCAIRACLQPQGCNQSSSHIVYKQPLSYGGLCVRCGQHHALPVSPGALCAAQAVAASLDTFRRFDYISAQADPDFSTDYVWTKGPGRMLGVLDCLDKHTQEHVVLKAFSGQLTRRWECPGWAGPVAAITHTSPIYKQFRHAIESLTQALEQLHSITDSSSPQPLSSTAEGGAASAAAGDDAASEGPDNATCPLPSLNIGSTAQSAYPGAISYLRLKSDSMAQSLNVVTAGNAAPLSSGASTPSSAQCGDAQIPSSVIPHRAAAAPPTTPAPACDAQRDEASAKRQSSTQCDSRSNQAFAERQSTAKRDMQKDQVFAERQSASKCDMQRNQVFAERQSASECDTQRDQVFAEQQSASTCDMQRDQVFAERQRALLSRRRSLSRELLSKVLHSYDTRDVQGRPLKLLDVCRGWRQMQSSAGAPYPGLQTDEHGSRGRGGRGGELALNGVDGDRGSSRHEVQDMNVGCGKGGGALRGEGPGLGSVSNQALVNDEVEAGVSTQECASFRKKRNEGSSTGQQEDRGGSTVMAPASEVNVAESIVASAPTSEVNAIVGNEVMAAGTGDCAAIKLLHAAANNPDLQPVGLVEFWYGSPVRKAPPKKDAMQQQQRQSGRVRKNRRQMREVARAAGRRAAGETSGRQHGHTYGACAKCEQILGTMLCPR
ncbi:hypothetical protein DUNSADRAFT_8939 [Dunaliella salina]|uniref:Uncharacterized protein n=1 Tax=Dunaliella salina TaxID=3046 RepID=A0ABQ7GIG1_DUNSA|nr:hypothetical protein DUNSADRAFT_8939 [Dunaliella salina]|eukprot:KAF5834409.1 hypothetical protein DUNSADRAFT_8939 [Dunaliella salina]